MSATSAVRWRAFIGDTPTDWSESLLASYPGLLRGDGIFESIGVIAGRSFRRRQHLSRAHHGFVAISDGQAPATNWWQEGAPLHPDIPTIDQLEGSVADLVSETRRQPGGAGSSPTGRVNVYVVGDELSAPLTLLGYRPALDTASTDRSLKAVTGPYTRDAHRPLNGLKSMSWGDSAMVLRFARARDADEYIFCTAGGLMVSEGARSNVIVADAASLLTPRLNSGCLAGVTRHALLEIGAVRESDLPSEMLDGRCAVGLSASPRGLTPLSHLDGNALPYSGLIDEAHHALMGLLEPL